MEAQAVHHTATRTPPPKSAITASIEVVTPELAASLIRDQAKNRPIKRAHVTALVKEIKEDRWKATHQGIALNPEGRLIDGQHRLLAVIEADQPVEMLISYDVPDDAFDVIDQHSKRTSAQMLAMSGLSKDPSRVVPMARAILMIIGDALTGVRKPKYTNAEVAHFAVENIAHFEPFLRIAKQFSPACGAAFAWAHSLGWRGVIEASERLVTAGPWEEPQETDPMRALLNRSHEFATKLGSGQARINAVFDITVNALQAIHEGRGLRQVKSTRPKYEKLLRDSMTPQGILEIDSVHPPKQTELSPSLYPDESAEEALREAIRKANAGEDIDEETQDVINAEVAKQRAERRHG